jgi:hypothetical protein
MSSVVYRAASAIAASMVPVWAYTFGLVAPEHPALWVLAGGAALFSAHTAAAWAGRFAVQRWIGRIQSWGVGLTLAVCIVQPYEMHPWTDITTLAGLVLLIAISALEAWSLTDQAARQRKGGASK